MKLTIISCSARQNNTTAHTAAVYHKLAIDQAAETQTVAIDSFNRLFTRDYLSLANANDAQKQVLDHMIEADVLLFIVPTYYKSLPGSAKNFFDIVKCPEAYANKVIGFVASNHKNQDYGARHAVQIVNGLLIFFQIHAIMVPEIIITNPAAPDAAEASRCIELLRTYHDHYPAP